MPRRALASAHAMVLAVLLVAAWPLPARAGPPPGPREAVRAAAFSRLDALRPALATGRLGDAVEAVAGLAGVRPRAAEAAPLPLPPGALARTLGRLVGAVEEAGRLARSALRVPVAELTALRHESHRPTRVTSPGAARDAARVEALTRRAGRAVDRRVLYSGALLLARALDEAVPVLRAAAVGLPPGPGPEAGCDVAEVGQALCVGGTGTNTYTKDYSLLVDLGGDDLHANSAGGGWLLNPASVTVDLGGNDTYETDLPTAAGAFLAQGAGILGVGFLVDLAGDDRYAVRGKRQGDLYGQGAGGGAGFGMLADLGGNDSYSLTNVNDKDARISGQGYGDTGGAGVMLDAGGNDAYLVEGRSCGGCHVETRGFAYAELAGAAVHADGGGADTMTLRGSSDPVAPDDPAPPEGRSVEVNTQGFANASFGSQAVALSGEGPTTRTASAENASPQAFGLEVRVFAHAYGGSYAAVDDAGGNDVYAASATARWTRRVRADDACACDGAVALARADQASVIGMGHGYLAGVGALRDGAGDDRYVSVATSVADAEARDDRTALPPPSPVVEDYGATAEAVVQYSNYSIVQGAGLSGGAGLLEDRGGNDVYQSLAGSQVRASASAYLAESRTEATASAAAGVSLAQGYGAQGYGELRDLGGNDSYTSTASVAAFAEPATQVSAGSPSSQVQGDGSAWVFDVGGASDAFASTPPNPACVGTRGQGYWVDCSNTGGGVNA